MAEIVHLIHHLGRGGAARATLYLAKYSQRLSSYRHAIISIAPADAETVTLAKNFGVQVLSNPSREELLSRLANADIVQCSWWNNVELNNLLRSELPPMRSVGWFHVGGASPPHIITPRLLSFFDRGVACSPYTYKCPAFERFRKAGLGHRLAMVYGATDFERLSNLQPKSHTGFNVGYIGVLDFSKMHPDFVALSASVNLPNANFLVVGDGGARETIKEQAKSAGIENKLTCLGYREDIRPLLEVLDVYGYPLCPETYAASEMNLQEVMFAGIPPVVFPHGGIRDLVIHNETGLVAQSAAEYKAMIEFLFHHPEERSRLGAGAKRYAEANFGAENAARAITPLYDELLKQQKRHHNWDSPCLIPEDSAQRLLPEVARGEGFGRFIESLGDSAAPFLESVAPKDISQALSADFQIMEVPEVMFHGGIVPYSGNFPSDPFLSYWSGLVNLKHNNASAASNTLIAAVNNNFPDWRVLWFLTVAAKRAGQTALEQQASTALRQCLAASYDAATTSALAQEFAKRGYQLSLG